MEYYNNILCISKPELTDGDPKSSDPALMPVMSVAAYDSYVKRFPHIRVRKGGGPNHPALLNYNLLRSDIKQRVLIKYGDVKEANRVNKLEKLITPDYQAAKYYREYMMDEDNGISPERQKEYAANASVLNAIGQLLTERTGNSKKLGNSTAGVWDEINELVMALPQDKYPHTLPTATTRLKEKYMKYAEGGYYELIHKGRGNANSRKRTPEIDNLIISLYCQSNLPFGEWCVENYLRFVAGEVEIVNYETGELIDRSNFYDSKRGTYTQISRGTMWNILNEPSTANLVDRLRNNRIDHVTQQTPYNHRHSPRYSLSKISMDDRTLSRKTTDGRWLNVYMAVDVMSGAWLSAVHSIESPTVGMVWDCFRELYRTIDSHGLMWPGEVEVENHLMSGIRKELEAMFTYVTFCAPGLSRSKRAEHAIHAKKYGDEKRNQVGIGRHNQKGAYKTKSENKDEDYKQPRIPLATLIQDDIDSIRRHNAELHPDQKRFPGKSRWQVLVENQHPDLGRPVKSLLMRYIGIRTETSIRNNDFVRVQYQDYAIDNLMNLDRLKPNNKEVVACYLPPLPPLKGRNTTPCPLLKEGNSRPEDDVDIKEVWLYQDETFIGRASLIERYNEAKMERTEEDERIRTEQAKRQAHFFKVERDLIAEKVTKKLGVVSTSLNDRVSSKKFDDVKVEIIPEPEEQTIDLDKLVEQYSGGWYEIGIENA